MLDSTTLTGFGSSPAGCVRSSASGLCITRTRIRGTVIKVGIQCACVEAGRRRGARKPLYLDTDARLSGEPPHARLRPGGIALPIRATITLYTVWAQLEIRAVDVAKTVVSSHGRGVPSVCGLTADIGISHGLSGAHLEKQIETRRSNKTKRPHGTCLLLVTESPILKFRLAEAIS